jgi:hypothetical protein
MAMFVAAGLHCPYADCAMLLELPDGGYVARLSCHLPEQRVLCDRLIKYCGNLMPLASELPRCRVR